MSDNDQERTHQPTSARRTRAAEEGRVPQSQELTSASAFLIVVALLWSASDRVVGFLSQMFVAQVMYARRSSLQPELMIENLREILFQLVTLLAPAMAVVIGCIWLIQLAHRQFSVRLSILRPDLGRLSLASRFQQVFSWRTVSLQIEKLIKFSTLALTLSAVVYSQRAQIGSLMHLDLALAVGAAWRIITNTLMVAAGIMFAIAILDYGLQRWRFEISLRMTDDELREETRAARRGK